MSLLSTGDNNMATYTADDDLEAQYLAAQVLATDLVELPTEDLRVTPNLYIGCTGQVMWCEQEVGCCQDIRRAVDLMRVRAQLNLWSDCLPGSVRVATRTDTDSQALEFIYPPRSADRTRTRPNVEHTARLVVSRRGAYWTSAATKLLSGRELFYALKEWARATQS